MSDDPDQRYARFYGIRIPAILVGPDGDASQLVHTHLQNPVRIPVQIRPQPQTGTPVEDWPDAHPSTRADDVMPLAEDPVAASENSDLPAASDGGRSVAPRGTRRRRRP